jgi:phosphomannomutase / phosphoglucomutase
VALAVQENIKQMDYQVPTQIPQQLFRMYDIRGIADKAGITENLAYALGLAIGSEVLAQQQQTVIVGRDGRLSGPKLTAALIGGLRRSGCNVIDIGMVSSPILYFATNRLDANSGVMVTASHNPGAHNGFKMVINGKTINAEAIQNLYHRICQQNFNLADEEGHYQQQDIIEDYLNFITDRIKLKRKLKIVIDCGNGAGGLVAPQLYRRLGCDVTELYCEVDGNFPNHHPDPSVPENLREIINTVKATNADIGLAFDGDADRLGVITNHGDVIWPDRQMILFSQAVLEQHPGSEIVFDVKCTKHLAAAITAAGGKPVMYKTGHSILKNKMLEINAPLAGEMSGHIFFNDEWFGFDDGVYAGARLLQIIANSEQSVDEIFNALPNSINTPELKLPMPEERKQAFMQQVLVSEAFNTATKITIDGLRVEFADSWGLIRPSNTSPYLIVRFEADNDAAMQRIQDLFRQVLLDIDAKLKLPF